MTDRPLPRRILTVCLGNYCRSPFAAAVLSVRGGGALEVRSAGLLDLWVGGTAHPSMIAAAADRGYDLSGHTPARVDRHLIDRADLVLAMDRSVLEELRAVGGAANERKLRLYLGDRDVPDPMGKPASAFAECAAIIESGADPYLP
ncbi:low molecular weight protein-tyrosine-phosphatase [Kitasatospora sp. NPDC059571]|uniref:low molecular weight protein-tyrosine-phosphatase n=1 Tax=Kitasatospora sp. NPDC059571 TaxID=3346871 RepID=UPI0036B42C8D